MVGFSVHVISVYALFPFLLDTHSKRCSCLKLGLSVRFHSKMPMLLHYNIA